MIASIFVVRVDLNGFSLGLLDVVSLVLVEISMSSVSIIKLPRSVVERLEREAKRMGMSLEEYVLELLLRDLDPLDRAREYIEAAKSLLEQVREELARGDVRQAAEKVWCAAALAIKSYAMWRERKELTSYRELWEYRRVVERELGYWVYDAWMAANGMHTCFYEGWCSREDVEEALERVAKLVNGVAERVR